ncbi:MAG: phytanoyl-CoA dioxygenase family protein [Microthrixaceae bacterium]
MRSATSSSRRPSTRRVTSAHRSPTRSTRSDTRSTTSTRPSAEFSRTEDLASVAEALGVGGHVLVQSMYIFKSARIGGEVNCHDDHTFLFTDPATCVGFWFAIDDATVDNGCLWAEPGGHRHPPRKRFRRSADGGTAFDVLDPDPYPSDGLVPLEAPRGTLVVLDGLLPHRSGPNRSDLPRHAYTLHAIDPRASYPEDNWLQRPDLPLRGFRG